MTAKELAAKTTLTKKEKDFLIAEAKRLNIEFEVRPDCGNCYQDLALQIYLAEKEAEVELPELSDLSDKKYVLKEGTDFIIVGTGERVNEATLTDEMAERLVAKGLTKFFEKYE